jgi:hypothetical protein
MEEAVAVATALGVSLPVTVDRRFEAAFAVGDHRTSMLQDLDARKPLEYDCMTGAVTEIAGHLDVPVPRIAAVHALIKALDAAIQHQATAAAGVDREVVLPAGPRACPSPHIRREAEHPREVTS